MSSLRQSSALTCAILSAVFLRLAFQVTSDSCQDPVWTPLNLSDPIIVDALASVRSLLVARAPSVPSFSLSINYGEETLFSLSMGSNLTSLYRIDSHTIYRIGSVTKVFTTLLAFQSLDRQLDAPLSTLVPELKPLAKCFERIRLRNVMSHLAGLPRESPCPLFGCNISNSDAISTLKELCEQGLFIAPPDALPSYSNFGFSVLGRLILQRLLKTSWEGLVAKKIVEPLQLADTAPTWSYLSPAAQARAVPGFSGSTPVALPGAQLLWDSPAGEMWSSSSDLVKFLTQIVKVGSYNMATPGESVASALNLNPASARLWLNEMEYLNSDGSGWGLPWEVAQKFSPSGNWRILGKGGSVPGYLSHIASIPRIRLTFALLINGGADMEGWRDDVFSLIVPALYKVLSQADTYSSEAPLPANPSRYVGTYVFPLNPQITAQIRLVATPSGSFLVVGITFGTPYNLLLRSSGLNPAHLQVGSTFKGLGCMASEMMGFENQFAIFTFANQSDPTSLALTLSFPGVVYGVTLNRVGNVTTE